MSAGRSRAWTFTLHDYSDDDIERIKGLADKANYMVFGKEVCPKTQRPHLQGYIRYKQQRPMHVVKSEIGDRAHLERAKGSDEHNKTYCSKDGQVFEHGRVAKPGARNDLSDYVKAVQEGATFTDLAERMPEVHARHYRFGDRLRFEFGKKRANRFRDIKVVCLYGPTKVHKTRRCVEWCQRGDPEGEYFIITPEERSALWWDGYDGHSEIIIDEFTDSALNLAGLFRILDGYKYRAGVKGSFTWGGWTTVFITSNLHPSSWYINETQAHKDALMGRFTEIIHVTSADQDIPNPVDI